MAGQLASRKEHIRRRLQRLVLEDGVTRAQLARVCDVSAPTVTNWLKGRNSIDIENLHKICERFDVPLTDFFGTENKSILKLSTDDLDVLHSYRKLQAQDKSKVRLYINQLLAASKTAGRKRQRISFGEGKRQERFTETQDLYGLLKRGKTVKLP